jgi:hypothetical protein
MTKSDQKIQKRELNSHTSRETNINMKRATCREKTEDAERAKSC